MSVVGNVGLDRAELLRFIAAGSVDGEKYAIGRLLHDSKSILEDQLSSIAKTSSKRGIRKC